MNHRVKLTTVGLAIAALLSACASDPAPKPEPKPILSGEQMLRDSQGIAQLGTRWQEGKDMVERGQALQREGQLKIDEGLNLIQEGEKIMRESEEGYKNIKK